ncbi:MAG: hypothetical protein WED10_08295 [Brumimicrobium sp.]
MKQLILHIVIYFIASQAFTQDLNLNIDKEEVQIGEPFKVVFSIVSDESFDSIRYNPSAPIFYGKETSKDQSSVVSKEYELEVQEEFSDTTYDKDGEFVWKGTYQLVGWDSAYVVIPPEKIYVNDSIHNFPAGLIQITSPIANASKEIYDINEDFTDIPEEKFLITRFLAKHGWWIGLALALMIFLIVILVRKRRKGKFITPLSLREKTLKEIETLEKNKGYEVDLKEFYFDLSILLRKFLAAHYKLRMLDKTTSEIEHILSAKGLEKETIKLVTKILTQSDMVKFAQSKPPVSEIFEVTNQARRVVNEIADLDLISTNE